MNTKKIFQYLLLLYFSVSLEASIQGSMWFKSLDIRTNSPVAFLVFFLLLLPGIGVIGLFLVMVLKNARLEEVQQKILSVRTLPEIVRSIPSGFIEFLTKAQRKIWRDNDSGNGFLYIFESKILSFGSYLFFVEMSLTPINLLLPSSEPVSLLVFIFSSIFLTGLVAVGIYSWITALIQKRKMIDFEMSNNTDSTHASDDPQVLLLEMAQAQANGPILIKNLLFFSACFLIAFFVYGLALILFIISIGGFTFERCPGCGVEVLFVFIYLWATPFVWAAGLLVSLIDTKVRGKRYQLRNTKRTTFIIVVAAIFIELFAFYYPFLAGSWRSSQNYASLSVASDPKDIPGTVREYGKKEKEGGMDCSEGVLSKFEQAALPIADTHSSKTFFDVTGNVISCDDPLWLERVVRVTERATRSGLSLSKTRNVSTPFSEKSRACDGTPSMTDADGNIYPTIGIGKLCWQAENMRTTVYPSGKRIAKGPYPEAWNGSDNGYYAFPSEAVGSNLDELMTDVARRKLGLLYQWSAAVATSEDQNAVGQGICPAGWRLPTESESEDLPNAKLCEKTSNGLECFLGMNTIIPLQYLADDGKTSIRSARTTKKTNYYGKNDGCSAYSAFWTLLRRPTKDPSNEKMNQFLRRGTLEDSIKTDLQINEMPSHSDCEPIKTIDAFGKEYTISPAFAMSVRCVRDENTPLEQNSSEISQPQKTTSIAELVKIATAESGRVGKSVVNPSTQGVDSSEKQSRENQQPTVSPQPAAIENFFEVKELGFKIPISDYLKSDEFTYTVSADGTQTVKLSTKQLKTLSEKCQDGSIGTITKIMGVVPSDAYYDANYRLKGLPAPKNVSFGDFYLSYEKQTAPCALGEAASQQTDVINHFSQLFSKVVLME
jgi:uncharacterized protein (TIGR02145 family)